MIGLGTDASMHNHNLKCTRCKELNHFYDIWQIRGKSFGANSLTRPWAIDRPSRCTFASLLEKLSDAI